MFFVIILANGIFGINDDRDSAVFYKKKTLYECYDNNFNGNRF